VLLALSGALATSVLFAADAFFAFSGWRVTGRSSSWGRAVTAQAHTFAEKREPLFIGIAMAASIGLALTAGPEHPRAGCLAGGAFVALLGHLLAYKRTACMLRGLGATAIGSSERASSAAKLETAMVTRASLLGAALICIVAAGLVS
jgi:hypothetical protein